MSQKFNDLTDGTKFTFNGTEYEKITPIKVSCCKSINAKSTANEQQKIFVPPNTEVETNS